jgi:hypothetical protein
LPRDDDSRFGCRRPDADDDASSTSPKSRSDDDFCRRGPRPDVPVEDRLFRLRREDVDGVDDDV